jgi:hypothetical protein
VVDRLKVETILTRRFPGATEQQIAAAANALMGLNEEWEEVADPSQVRGHAFRGDLRGLSAVPDGEFRVFRRREI